MRRSGAEASLAEDVGAGRLLAGVRIVNPFVEPFDVEAPDAA